MSRATVCNRPGCGHRIIFATRSDTGRLVPYEAEPVDGTTAAAAGCHVITGQGRTRQAHRPPDLAAQFQVTFELPTIAAARQKVAEGYPHHRPHFHLDDARVNDTPATRKDIDD